MVAAAIQQIGVNDDEWPALPLNEWRDTCATLHMWTQVVGKVRVALTPLLNHWWNAPLHLTARGLGTGAMPYHGRDLEVRFDFIEHDLTIDTSDGRRKTLPLVARPVADFYQELMMSLRALDVDVRIATKPVEVSDPIPFEEDRAHASYDPVYAHRFWRALLASEQVMQEFRAGFIGKCSPVHFFWGSFDLAVTRFSGRLAPARPGADRITREAYSHEVISHGFWPGGDWFGTEVTSPIYYSYTAPGPAGLGEQPIRPTQARYDVKLSEFVLPYDAVRQSRAPRQMLMEFLQSTYEAGARLAQWDRAALERRLDNPRPTGE